MNEIKDCLSKLEIKQRLKNLPAGVEQAFDNILERIDKRFAKDINPGKEALMWILYSNAVSVDTLRYALAVDPDNVQFDHDGLYSWKAISHLCCGLLEATSISEDDFEDPFRIIRFTHSSFHEYLELAWKPKEQEYRTLIYRKMLKCFAYKFNDSILQPGESQNDNDFMAFAKGAVSSFVKTIPPQKAFEIAVDDLEVDFEDGKMTEEGTYKEFKLLFEKVDLDGCPPLELLNYWATVEYQFDSEDGLSEEALLRKISARGWKTKLRCRTLVMFIYYGVPSLAARLLREPLPGFDPGAMAKNSEYLFYAVQYESMELISGILETKLSDPRYMFEEHVDPRAGMTIESAPNLTFAINKGRQDILKVLLENGAPTHDYGPHGDTPIHAATAKGSIDMISLLLENGANINQMMCTPHVGHETDYSQQRMSWRPLHIACRQGKTRVADFLVQRGADLNAQAMSGATPLHIIASFGDDTASFLDIIQILLANDADVAIRDRLGRVAYQAAHERGLTQMSSILWDAMVSENRAGVSATGQRKIFGHPRKPVTRRLKKKKKTTKTKANASQPPSETLGTSEDVEGLEDLSIEKDEYEISPCQSSEEDILLDDENDDDDDDVVGDNAQVAPKSPV